MLLFLLIKISRMPRRLKSKVFLGFSGFDVVHTLDFHLGDKEM